MKLSTNIKHLDVALRALRCVDVECLGKGTSEGQEYAAEMFQKWQTAMYAIGDLLEAFEAEQYAADNSD